jgi:hypothetical protein
VGCSLKSTGDPSLNLNYPCVSHWRAHSSTNFAFERLRLNLHESAPALERRVRIDSTGESTMPSIAKLRSFAPLRTESRASSTNRTVPI